MYSWKQNKTRHIRGKKPAWFGWLTLSRPEAATMEAWNRIDASLKRRYPVRWFITHTIPRTFGRLRQRYVLAPIWWLKYRTTHRYHVIKPTTLHPGWVPYPEVALHTMFHLFVEHVDKDMRGLKVILDHKAELTEIIAKPETDDESKKVYGEIVADYVDVIRLYEWWKARPNRKDPFDLIVPDDIEEGDESRDYESFYALRDEQTAEDQQMLELLISKRLRNG